jgi:hypothetical protein
MWPAHRDKKLFIRHAIGKGFGIAQVNKKRMIRPLHQHGDVVREEGRVSRVDALAFRAFDLHPAYREDLILRRSPFPRPIRDLYRIGALVAECGIGMRRPRHDCIEAKQHQRSQQHIFQSRHRLSPRKGSTLLGRLWPYAKDGSELSVASRRPGSER